MKKVFLGFFAVLVVITMVLSGCSQPTPAPAATQAPASSQAPATTQAPAATTQAPAATQAVAPVLIKYGHDMAPTNAPTVGPAWWAAEVTKRTEGRVKVEMYPSATLATQADAMEAVRSGVADMYFISASTHRKFLPINAITQVPGIGFPDDTTAANVAHVNTYLTMLNKYPAAAAEFKDFAPVFFYCIYSESYLCSKSKLVTVPADIKGMKIGSNGLRLDFVNKIGGAGVTDVPPTAYEKLQTGVTDGAFAAISAVHDFKIYEVSKYILDVPFGGGGHPQIINKKTWDKISPKDQQIMKDLAPEASRLTSESVGNLNAASWKEVAGMNKRTTATKDQRALWDKEFTILWEQYIKENEANGFTDARALLTWWKAESDKVWASQ
jgi:TRAP-type C4-dicarboxylate transport system substrate-binding protein